MNLEASTRFIQQNFSLVKIIGTNLYILVIEMVGGLSFGDLTIISLLYNGFIMRKLLKSVCQIDTHLFLNLLPHSIEVLGFIPADAIGLRLRVLSFNYAFQSKKEFKTSDIRFFVYGALGSVAVIIFSGLVEYYIFPNL